MKSFVAAFQLVALQLVIQVPVEAVNITTPTQALFDGVRQKAVRPLRGLRAGCALTWISDVFILEPMLATGGSISIQLVLEKYPGLHIVTAAVDEKLNAKSQIMPGLGDFGDRFFVIQTSPPSSPRKRARMELSLNHVEEDAVGPSPDAQATSYVRPQQAPSVAQNFVNGEFSMSKSRAWRIVLDPVTQKVLTRLPESTAVEVQHAVQAAKSAQRAWAGLSLAQRRLCMLKWLDVMRKHASDVQRVLQFELGKTGKDAESEILRAIESLEAVCTTTTATGQHWSTQGMDTYTVLEPLGVCAVITPFNFPFMIPLWSIPTALMAGNTIVLKPSEKAPGVAELLARYSQEAEFPPGIFNVVHGGSGAVDKLLADHSVSAVTFVGSEVAGERVYNHGKATKKRVQVETSGKNHGVVLPDATKTSTLYAVAGSAFGTAGQRCMALSVMICVGSTKDWIDDLVQLARSLKVGCGFDPATSIGPLVTASAKEQVMAVIDLAEEEGAEILLDGRQCTVHDYPDGNFVGPTIITKVKTYMQCYQNEIFGPVLVCLEVETLQEAIETINNNRYGNGCTLFTTDPTQAQIFQREVNVGHVGINVPILASSGAIPRTTNKDSFLGDNPSNRNQWEFFTSTKTVSCIWR
ncbi:Aldehyde/histidinol dehydrogenase [Stachybotrys elegans]|uniref:methylmalonate-semialdehyde dehydrogenase (CoA acylating) n=1 Tax=Stachybotrys elegans TaxID=80388 RepID=A0A8K0SEW5_9HYPO|nr:Aldehyde/histidinol dehydrogenase [Stachybotrys elegans]